MKPEQAKLLKKGQEVMKRHFTDDPDIFSSDKFFFDELVDKRYSFFAWLRKDKEKIAAFHVSIDYIELPKPDAIRVPNYHEYKKSLTSTQSEVQVNKPASIVESIADGAVDFNNLISLDDMMSDETIEEKAADILIEGIPEPLLEETVVTINDEPDELIDVKSIDDVKKPVEQISDGLFAHTYEQPKQQEVIQTVVEQQEIAREKPVIQLLPPEVVTVINDSMIVTLTKEDSVYGDFGITSIKSKSIDLIVTDPPYGMEFQSNFRKVKFDKIVNDNNLKFLPQLFRECNRVMKDNSHMYCFCSWHHIDTFKKEAEAVFGKGLKNMLVWEKQHQGMGDLEKLGHSTEFILFIEKGNRPINYIRDSNIIKFPSTGNILHPTEKPVELIQFLVHISSNKGETVLDLFAGSATTGIACINESRNGILYELTDVHFETAKNRLQKYKPDLFASGLFKENKTKVDKYIDAIKASYMRKEKDMKQELNKEIVLKIRELIIETNGLDMNRVVGNIIGHLSSAEDLTKS